MIVREAWSGRLLIRRDRQLAEIWRELNDGLTGRRVKSRRMKTPSCSSSRATGTAFLSLLFCSALAAQPVTTGADIVEREPDEEIETTITFGYIGKTEFKGDGSSGVFPKKAGGTEFEVGLGKNLQIDAVSSFSGGIEFQTRDFGTDTGDNVPVPERLQSLSFELGYFRVLNDRWSMLASAEPGFHAADSSFDSDSFGVKVGAVAIYQFSPALRLGFGFGVNFPGIGDTSLSPRLMLEWQPDERWAFRVGYPATEIAYTFDSGLELAFQATGEPFGEIYYVKDDPAPGVAGKPSLRDSAVEYSDLRLGLAVRQELAGGFDLEASVGVVVNQEFEYTETGGKDYTVESDGSPVFFSLGVSRDF